MPDTPEQIPASATPTDDVTGHRRPRPAVLVGASLMLLATLAIAPLLPDGDEPDDGAIQTTGTELHPAATAGQGRLTPALEDEIDRVLARGAGVATYRGAPTAQVVDDLVRCADFEGQAYCLAVGWTTRSEDEVRHAARAAVDQTLARRGTVETTGDLDQAAALAARARMTPAARARAERRELTHAARAVAKVWLLRHHVEGTPLPAGFLERHPEAVAPTSARVGTTTTARRKTYADYPGRTRILRNDQVQEQTRSYWCGPATMQMIAWGWHDRKRSQKRWADRLNTTTSGTAITDLVRVTNRRTGWGGEEYAGTYIVLDVGDYSFTKWMTLQMRHLVDYRAPVILHPVLLKRFYPYLDDDASGHYQVGRGYRKRGDKPDQLGFFEPWNQQRFDPSEPFIERVQWRRAYKSYRANLAHWGHNVGV